MRFQTLSLSGHKVWTMEEPFAIAMSDRGGASPFARMPFVKNLLTLIFARTPLPFAGQHPHPYIFLSHFDFAIAIGKVSK